jgi:hypothetical protein
VRELERERVTVQQAAARLGITESAVRKRARKGDLRSEKVVERNRERLYVFLDPDAEPFPEPFREKYMRSLEDRVKTLEDEAMRQQAIILSMSQSLRALTGAPEPSQGVEEAQEEVEPRPSAGGERETTRPPATSAPTSRLGMSARALAVGAIATPLSWFLFMRVLFTTFSGPAGVPIHTGRADVLFFLLLPVLVPLMSGLWAGSTKRPSLPWFSSPHKWLRRGGRSALEFALFATGIPAMVGFNIGPVLLAGPVGWFQYFFGPPDSGELLLLYLIALGVIAGFTSLAFMSGAFLGNALRRVGFLGTPKELPQGEEEGHGEEEVWSAKKEAQWGLAGSIIVALISAVASVLAAALSQ